MEPTTAAEVDQWVKALVRARVAEVEILARLEALQAANDDVYTRVHQLRALRLSKNSELPPERKHPHALEILKKHVALDTTHDRETLGIAGGICKRMWRDDGNRANLDRALGFYLRGHNSPHPGNDFYTSINAAFIEELIAEEELLADAPRASIDARYARAEQIDRDIIAAVTDGSFVPDGWWQHATVAEAYIGLGEGAQAFQWLRKGRPGSVNADRTTTLAQLAHLVSLQARRRGRAWQRRAELHLAHAFKINRLAVRTAIIGKVGLALSGGGFRAALFHIGVLARLAEVDLLRHVEVLSCVSGGSIVGAQYYLELRAALQEKGELTPADYVAIVHRLETEFLRGVQTNIRTSAAMDLKHNLDMIFEAGYTRTERIAQLYEEKLFASARAKRPIALDEIKIFPSGTKGFHPEADNWKRASKVPILILNATTLNTGHQWQFTTTSMGEPPYTRYQLDAVEIIPRRRYRDGEKVLLSRAVAASAGVPGLFAPLIVEEDGRAIALVDGGVHDNQGVASLIAEQECKTILVSDASGQLASQEESGGGVIAPVLRANSILQARLREAQIMDLLARRRAGLLQGFTFVHMTMGLPNAANAAATPTTYGVRQDLQKMLAELRTDLDTFTDAEAYSLMTSGYRMMSEALASPLTSPRLAAMAAKGRTRGWDFLRVGSALDGSDAKASQALYDLLATRAKPQPRSGMRLLAAILLLPVAILLLPFAIALLVLLLLVIPLARYRDPRRPKPLDEIILGTLLALFGFPLANLYLSFFEPRRLRRGAWHAPR